MKTRAGQGVTAFSQRRGAAKREMLRDMGSGDLERLRLPPDFWRRFKRYRGWHGRWSREGRKGRAADADEVCILTHRDDPEYSRKFYKIPLVLEPGATNNVFAVPRRSTGLKRIIVHAPWHLPDVPLGLVVKHIRVGNIEQIPMTAGAIAAELLSRKRDLRLVFPTVHAGVGCEVVLLNATDRRLSVSVEFLWSVPQHVEPVV